MKVEQIDREAAVEYWNGLADEWNSWTEISGQEQDATVQAFARHRHQARTEVVREIVAWFEEMYENCESIDGMLTRMDSKDELAKMMQAKFGGRDAG